MHCEVCNGKTSADVNPLRGQIEALLSWGPNSFNGVIDEQSVGIIAYAVFAVDHCGLRSGQALATVAASRAGRESAPVQFA